MPETIAQRRRDSWPAVPLFLLVQGVVGFRHPRRKAYSEDLPISLQPQAHLGQPCPDVIQQPPQLPLIGAEDGEVVHLPQIVAHTILLLVDHQIQRLEQQMQEPCGEERADQDSVLHQRVAQPERFPVLEQTFQRMDDIRRVHLHKAVVNVALRAVLGAHWVILHPFLQNLYAIGVAAPRHACDAILVHAPLDVRNHGLHYRVVDILVRPQKRLIDIPPFPFAAVRVPVPFPPLQGFMHMLVSGHQVFDELAEFYHIFIDMLLDFHDLLI